MRLLIVGCALALVATLASPASADMPPPPGYVEKCTLEREQHHGETCVECAGHLYDREACSRTHGKEGFAQRCISAGASHWREIWCKRGNGLATQPASSGSAHAKGCTIGDGSSSPASAGAALLAVVASLVLVRALRRRR